MFLPATLAFPPAADCGHFNALIEHAREVAFGPGSFVGPFAPGSGPNGTGLCLVGFERSDWNAADSALARFGPAPVVPGPDPLPSGEEADCHPSQDIRAVRLLVPEAAAPAFAGSPFRDIGYRQMERAVPGPAGPLPPTDPRFTVAPATPALLPYVTDLADQLARCTEGRTLDKALVLQGYREQLADPRLGIVLAAHAGDTPLAAAVVGGCEWVPACDGWALIVSSLIKDRRWSKSATGRGVSHAILAHVLRMVRATAAPVKLIRLIVKNDNPVQAMYRAAGFVFTGDIVLDGTLPSRGSAGA